MDTSIIVIWWIGLIVALILTLIVLKLVFLVVRVERDILKLAQLILPAAQGIGANTALIDKLTDTKGVAGKLLSAATNIEMGTSSVAQKLQAVGRALRERSL